MLEVAYNHRRRADVQFLKIVVLFFMKDGPRIWEFLLRPVTGRDYDRVR